MLQQLPPGLAAGVWVRTMAWDCGFWTVREISHPERFWRVSVTLLEVE